jgi:hypothetical protein
VVIYKLLTSLTPKHSHSLLYTTYNFHNQNLKQLLREVNRIKEQMSSIEFDSMIGFYDFQNIYGNAKEILEASLNKYV